MPTEFGDEADDFFVNLNLQTNLSLPTSRETVLHFCEAVQKEFPEMTSFYARDGGEYVLEGSRDTGSYRWMEIHAKRLSAGYFNPPTMKDAYRMQRWLLDRSTYYLGVSGLDVECLDVLFGFNFDYTGNRDAIVTQALLGNSPVSLFMSQPSTHPLECEPNLTVALDDECCLQARLSLETRSSSYQVRTGNYENDPITVYLTIRKYPLQGEVMDLQKAFTNNQEVCEDYTRRFIIPHVIDPIAAAIASAH